MDPSSWSAAVRDAATALLSRVTARLPDVLGAAVLLVAGYVLARLLRALVRKLLAGLLDRLQRGPLLAGDDRLGIRRSLPGVVGAFVFWAVMVVFTVAAADTLGLGAMGELLSSLARQLPRVLAGLLIAATGVALGSLTYGAVSAAAVRASLPYAATLGRAAQGSVVVLGLVMGAHQAGIDSTFLMITLPVVLAAVLGGAALAFGLGSRAAVSNIVASYHLARLFEVGQRVRIAGHEGRIVRMTPTAVVLDADEGRVVVPASLFGEQVSVMVEETER